MSIAIELHQPSLRRVSHLWKPVILAAGFKAEALELLVFWFSDIAEHPSEPVLVIVNETAPETADQLGLVAQVRSCPNSHFIKWANHADIFTVGAGEYEADYVPSCPTISVKPKPDLIQMGVNGFHARTGEEWRDAVRALLDDPALCLALSGRKEIPAAKRI